jgi:N-acetylglucosaminyldiphosphoundecaprenol N-acetyl-beta-D-mannosaminyltransferase
MAPVAAISRDRPDAMSILGVPIHLVDMSRAVDHIVRFARDDRTHIVFVRDVASLMLAVDNAHLRTLHEDASLVVPDGAPLVLVGRLEGHGERIGRVTGADLVDAVCSASLKTGQRHFFYGGKPGVAARMAAHLQKRHPGLSVAGTLTPPMREMDEDYRFDDQAMAELGIIDAAKPDFIWVGISSPKQEYWMHHAAALLGKGVCLGVGAAFDFHSGDVQRAPGWMRNHGLEWLHRLLSEPRRLWRRYLVLAPRFVFLYAGQRLARTFRKAP